MTADTVGGVWTYSMELAAALAPHGVELIVAVMGREPDAGQREQARLLPNVRLAVSSLRLEWMPEPWRDVDAAGVWLLGLAEREGVDLVHLNGYALGALDFGVPVVVVGHSCVLSWWRAVRGGDAPASWDTYRTRIAAGLRGAHVVVTPTRAMLGCLREHYGEPRAARVIPNGRHVRYVTPARKSPCILAAGRLWDEAKNIAALDRVAAGLPWPCLVAGEMRAPLGAGAAVGSGGVRPLGRLGPAEMAARYSEAAVFAHPARYEPFGLAPLEAGLAGCALVLGDIPSLREVWGDAAAYADPDDDAALRAALLRLIGDPDQRKRAGAAARRRAGEDSRRRMGEAYFGLYQELIGDRASPRPTGRAGAAPLAPAVG